MRDTMAGSEIQEPFSLSFQERSIHSGSISFGRFEEEGLSWEKRSSFSHNRYLEEVDKFSKPGSVTEMKAHFEAHFKKRGMRLPASLESQTWGARQRSEQDDDDDDAIESFEEYRSDGSFSENTSRSESPCNYRREGEECGKIQCEYVEECVSYDEIVVNSDDVIELDEEGGNLDVSLDKHEVVSVEGIAIKEGNYEDLGQQDIPLEIEIRDDDESKEHCIEVQETESRLVEHVQEKPLNVMERPSSACGPKSLANAKPISPKAVSVTKASTKRHDVTPKAASSLRAKSKTDVDAKSQKELRPKKTVESRPLTSKKTVESRPLTSKKVETRTPLATNRPKTGSYAAKMEMSTCASGFRFKCSERAEKRKEFYMKLEEKIHAKKTETNQVQVKTQQKAEAEMKQFRKSLNFKATPMPSFYNTITRPVSRYKTEPSKIAPPRPRSTASSRNTIARPVSRYETEPSKIAPPRPRSTTSASSMKRPVSRVGDKHGFEDGKTVKVIMVGNRKQSAAKDLDKQKGNFMAVETKQKIGTRKSGN